MKSLLLSSLLALTAVGSASAQVYQDNFDSYAPGTLPANGAWPGSTAPLLWNTHTGGTQSIVSGTPFGRTGNLYHAAENAAGQTTTYSSISLGGASNIDQWQLSVDFYLDEINPVSSSFFNLVSLGNDTIISTSNQLVRLGVSRRSASATGDLAFAYEAYDAVDDANKTYYKYSSNSDGNRIALNTWYTLTITGDKTTGTFVISVVGEDLDFTTDELRFRSGVTDFSTIAIGDTANNGWPAAGGRSNSIYLDNFQVRPIPEPALGALLPLGLLAFGAMRRIRNRHGR